MYAWTNRHLFEPLIFSLRHQSTPLMCCNLWCSHWVLPLRCQWEHQPRFDPVRLPKVTPAFPLRGSLSKLDKLKRFFRT